MSNPIRQHYIPRSYLNNFGLKEDDKCFIWGLNKGIKDPIRLSTKDICLEKNLYSIPLSISKDKFFLENYYADNIDSKFPEIYELIHNKELEYIDVESRIKVISIALNLYFRTPKFLNAQNDFYETLIKKSLEGKGEEEFTIRIFGEDILIKRELAKEIIKKKKEENRISFLIEHLIKYQKLVEANLNNVISVFHIDDDSEFITSDNPVFIRSKKTPIEENGIIVGFIDSELDPFDSNNMIHLIVDRKTMLSIIPVKSTKTESLFQRRHITKEDVLIYNNDVQQNSEYWILGSKEGINSYLEYLNHVENEVGEKFIESFKAKVNSINNLYKLMNKLGTKNLIVKRMAIDLNKKDLFKDDTDFKNLYKKIMG